MQTISLIRGWKIMEQLNVSQVLMWLTRACVLWLLCTSLPLFLYPWATLGFSLFFEHASCDGISSFCVVAVFGLECSCRTFMSDTLLLFRSQLGLFRSNNLQKPLSPSLPQYSVFFFMVIILSKWCGSTISYLFNSHLSFLATRILILFRIMVCPPKYSSFLFCLVLTVWPLKYKWVCAGSFLASFCSSDEIVDIVGKLSLPLCPPTPILNANSTPGVSVVLCDHEGKTQSIVETIGH